MAVFVTVMRIPLLTLATFVPLLLMRTSPAGAQDAEVRAGWVETADGVRLRYDAVGTGSDVVLIPHGFALRNALQRLAREDRTLVFYDSRNRGRSDTVEDSTKITVQGDMLDIEAVRKEFGVEQVSLVGYSVYGMLTALYAIEHPQRVRRLVQLGPVPIRYDPERYPTAPSVVDPAARARIDSLEAEGMSIDQPVEFCRLRWETFKIDLVGSDAAAERLRPPDCTLRNEWRHNFLRHLTHHIGSVQQLVIDPERVRATRVPVLTIHGSSDRNASYVGGREWAALFPEGRLLTIEDAAHNLWVDDPERVLGAIDAFLGGEWPEEAENL